MLSQHTRYGDTVQRADIAAPTISNYKFVSWIGLESDGSVENGYITTPTNANTRAYFKDLTTNIKIRATALYERVGGVIQSIILHVMTGIGAWHDQLHSSNSACYNKMVQHRTEHTNSDRHFNSKFVCLDRNYIGFWRNSWMWETLLHSIVHIKQYFLKGARRACAIRSNGNKHKNYDHSLHGNADRFVNSERLVIA